LAKPLETNMHTQSSTADLGFQEDTTSPVEGWFINQRDWRGMSRTFAENQFGDTPLIHYRGIFYRWIGTHYSATEDGDIRANVYQFLASAYTVVQETDENGETKTTRRRFYPDDRSVNKFLDALRSIVRVSGAVRTPAWLPGASEKMKSHKPADILPCRNGLLDLMTWELLPHTHTFLSMNAVSYDYDPEAKAPAWEKFIGEVFTMRKPRMPSSKSSGTSSPMTPAIRKSSHI
jgi:D5 N terminal like